MALRNIIRSGISCGRNMTCRLYSEGATYEGTRKAYTGERGINNVTLVGRIGRTPEMRGSAERPVTIFSLATSQSFKDASGQYTQYTDWHRIVVYRPGLRDVCANTLTKGDRVYVSGSIKYSEYQNQENQNIRVTNIVIDDMIMLGKSASQASPQDTDIPV